MSLDLCRYVIMFETEIARFDKGANGGNEVLRRLRAQLVSFIDGFEVIQLIQQLAFIESDVNAALLRELSRGCYLVIVSLLAQRRSAGHNYDSLSQLKRSNNGAHTCMSYHQARCFNTPSKFCRVNEPLSTDVLEAAI